MYICPRNTFVLDNRHKLGTSSVHTKAKKIE